MAERLSCEERDRLLLDKSTGGVQKTIKLYSSLTDPWGEFGTPRIDTTWEMEDGTLIRDVRHPKRGNYSGPDERPCEHWKEQKDD